MRARCPYLEVSLTMRPSIRAIPRSVMNHLPERCTTCLLRAADRFFNASRTPDADFGITAINAGVVIPSSEFSRWARISSSVVKLTD